MKFQRVIHWFQTTHKHTQFLMKTKQKIKIYFG